MNRRTKEISQELSLQAERWCYDNLAGPTPAEWNDKFHQKFAELIVKECTSLLFDESERLYGYSTECDNMRESDEAELVAEKCVDLITMIEEHFGIE